MFASELAKSTSICLGAFEGEQLVGYIINSRYVDAWHVMNVAVDPDFRRRGIATRLLERLFELTKDDGRRGYTLEVRVSNDGAIAAVRESSASSGGASGAATTRTTARTRSSCGARRRSASADSGRVILGIETSCDETAAALVTREGEIRVERRRLAGRAARALRRRRARDRVAAASRARLARDHARRSTWPARRLDDVDAVGVTAGPGLIGALLVGLAAAKALAWARGLPLVAVNHLHGHVASLYLQPLEPRAAVHLPARERRAHAAARRPRPRLGRRRACSGRRSTTRPARRSTRARGCSGSATRAAPRSTGSRAQGDPEAYAFPVARVPGLDFSFSGLKTALLYAVRDLPPEELDARRADLAASYQRAIVQALVGRIEAAGAETVAIVGGVAANSELRASLPDAVAAPLALCTDNAAMIASAARYTPAVPSAETLSWTRLPRHPELRAAFAVIVVARRRSGVRLPGRARHVRP